MRILKYFARQTGLLRKTTQGNRQQMRGVSGSLRESRAGLQSRNPEKSEVADLCFVAVELKRENQGQILHIEKTEISRQNADDLSRLPVHDQSLPNCRRMATEFVQPVVIGQQCGDRRTWGIIT